MTMYEHPEIVSWNVTNACNLHCAHCYLDAGVVRKGELSTEECYRVIDEMSELGTEMVIITGGEPLLRRDLLAIVSRTRKQGIMTVMGSNGTLLSDGIAGTLKEAGLQGVAISLDSLQAEKHDEFRGINGCWESAIAGMRCCLKQGLPVIVQTTLTSWNYQEVPTLIEFAQDLGATAFNLYYLVCTGRGEQLADISPQQYEESMASLVDAQALHPSIMVRAKCAPQVARIARQRGLPVAGGGCPAGTRYLRIDPDGQVTPCPYLPLVAGSVRETSLRDIWERSIIFQQLRSHGLAGRCGVCNYREICTGCRARAFALTGDYLGEDPWCLYQSVAASYASSPQITWTAEAQTTLQKVPAFVRTRVKLAVEGYARDRGHSVVTADLMTEVRSFIGGKIHRTH
ncbi:MAG: radical SAM protein [Dehalococcoidales bacterium]|nr:radical SAM protein [Dehalococcoidales bacterium]MDZ4230718.1 radical SAM protein [Dehalococcoidales bacterium]